MQLRWALFQVRKIEVPASVGLWTGEFWHLEAKKIQMVQAWGQLPQVGSGSPHPAAPPGLSSCSPSVGRQSGGSLATSLGLHKLDIASGMVEDLVLWSALE